MPRELARSFKNLLHACPRSEMDKENTEQLEKWDEEKHARCRKYIYFWMYMNHMTWPMLWHTALCACNSMAHCEMIGNKTEKTFPVGSVHTTQTHTHILSRFSLFFVYLLILYFLFYFVVLRTQRRFLLCSWPPFNVNGFSLCGSSSGYEEKEWTRMRKWREKIKRESWNSFFSNSSRKHELIKIYPTTTVCISHIYFHWIITKQK